MNENIIEIKNLSRKFGAKLALDDVTLSIPRGGVFGLVGENGAGKTTLIKHLLGLYKANSGSVRVFDMDPVTAPEKVLAKIGYLSEDRDLPDWMRVGELMQYTSAFYPTWDAAFAQSLVETFGLDPKQKIKTLSRGQRAQAGLLIALAHRPDLLLLDEPSSGLDPVARRDILTAIIRTVADEGRTVLFSSHLLEEVERVADTIGMIHAGQLVMCDTLDNIRSAHRKLSIQFKEAPRQDNMKSLPGILSAEGEGRDWVVICNGRIAELKSALTQMGAEITDERDAALDEIFVARVKG